MDLLSKTVVAAVVVVVILLGVYYALQSTILSHVSEQQAASLVTADLQNAYPSAIINITSERSSNYTGSWYIAASVVVNATSPCPSYYAYTFDYPKFGFVYRVQNTYTQDCRIYGLQQNTSFLLSSFPAAITRSYTLGIPSVMSFVQQYGFRNVSVGSHFYQNLSAYGKNYTKAWLVEYSAPKANHTVSVLLSQLNGTLLATYNSSG
jgi:hypothetical protein